MHHSVEYILRCFVTDCYTDWDVLLPMCEFALNSTESASTGHMPAYVLFGCEPVLPLEHAVHKVTDCPV